jgi:hypothetical protein
MRKPTNPGEGSFVANLLQLEPNADVEKVLTLVDSNAEKVITTWEWVAEEMLRQWKAGRRFPITLLKQQESKS